MKLTQIVIDDYNSIKNPLTITLNGGIITLLGKNGSGKSNILRAIRLFFNPSEFLGYQREASYHAILQLNEQEVAQLDRSLTYNEEASRVEVEFSLNDAKQKYVYSFAANVALSNLQKEIQQVYSRLQTLLNQYRQQLNDLNLKAMKSRPYDQSLLNTQEEKIEKILTSLSQDMLHIHQYLHAVMLKDKLVFNSEATLDLNASNAYESMKVKIPQYALMSLQDKVTSIDPQRIRKEVNRFNLALGQLSSQIDELLLNFMHLTRRLEAILNKLPSSIYLNKLDKYSKQMGFLDLIQKTLTKRCFYLDNEQSLLFKHQENKDLSYQGFKPRQNIIMESFYQYCLERKIIDRSVSKIDLASLELSKQERLLEHFSHFINDSLPPYDVNMIDTIQVGIVNHQFKLSVIEKSGDEIDFDDTSLGRRWYFTYLFIKKVLKKGDIFIIDEPASFLHPEAQKTILRELEELVKIGVIVILTTHSPYMISHHQSSIFFVSMTSQGTIAEKGDNQNYALLKDTIGEVGFNNLLLNLSKLYIIVEGPSDLACIKTFIRILGLEENKYEVWYLEGAYNIRRIKRFLENNHVNSVHLLDYDMKKNYKSEREGIIFVGEGTKEKSIEGLFSGKDKQRYFKKNKLAHEKIVTASIENIEKETLQNFKKLFKQMGLIQGKMDVS